MLRKVLGFLFTIIISINKTGLRTGITFYIISIFSKKRIRLNILGHQIALRTRTPDLTVAMNSLFQEFEPLSKLLPANFDGLLVDAGGYIGTAAIKLSEMYPFATVVSIEPATENFELLIENTRNYQQIVCIKAALAGKSTPPVSLLNRGTGEWGFTAVEDPLDAQQSSVHEVVETVTIADIVAKFPGKQIGLLKLDVEGGEKALFETSANSLSGIPIVFVELHDRIIHGCKDAFEKFSQDRWVIKNGGEKYLSLVKRSF